MNKNLFKTAKNTGMAKIPVTDTINNAGGVAYSMSAKHALAQLVCTGCFNDTYYVSSENQLDTLKELSNKVEPEFLAKLAIYSRQKSFMKDAPALLLAKLATNNSNLLSQVFNRVIDNPKMLRNFAQSVRSGVFGRSSFGTRPKKTVQERFSSWDEKTLFRGSVGNDPSLADVIKMVHPKPATPERGAMYRYLIGKDVELDKLPAVVQDFEKFKKGLTEEVPDVPFEMLTALPLTEKQWVQIARNASWTQTRMNLNTFLRHGVFKESGMDRIVADKLKDQGMIMRAKAFPYQLMIAYLNCDPSVPTIVKNALQEAMEHATINVPRLEGKVFVFPDVSGSMSSPVTGNRGTATSKVRYIDVAALVAATILRNNPEAEIVPFEGSVVDIKRLNMNPKDSIMTNAAKLAGIGGGSTNCSAPLALLNTRKQKGDLVVYVSDNESFIDTTRVSYWGGSSTATIDQWKVFKNRNPSAKMVCIDISPNKTSQAAGDKDILNIGGFSDACFEVVNTFLQFGSDPEHWVKEIENTPL